MSLGKFCFFSVLYKFASTSKLVKYFRGRYDDQFVRELNRGLRLRSKFVRSKENVRFLRSCLEHNVSPSVIKSRVGKGKPRNPRDIERAVIRDEIEKSKELMAVVFAQYRRTLAETCAGLSFMDRICYCKLVNETAQRLLYRTRTKKDKTIRWLVRTQLGCGQADHATITNLSDVELTDVEKDVLCRGLTFGVPPKKLCKEEIQAEFEFCWGQLTDTPSVSEQRREECRSALASLAHKYANSSVDKSGFVLDKEHMAALKNLKRNDGIVILRPDKGNGVVVMNKQEYIDKMNDILSQKDRFQKIGDVEKNDNTLLQERALQAFLLRQNKAGHITREVYDRIRPVGSTRPRMYGLPKVHKQGVPLRPILSMVNAPQQELAKWLAELLKPVVLKYSKHTVKDSFEFCLILDECSATQNLSETYMCSFDIVSLFTNVPLRATLDICLNTLYRDQDVVPPPIPENLLEKLLIKSTTDVEFSFNGVMYKQIDGVAMGSPLGPVLANIFVGHCESLIDQDKWPILYGRFVDDTFTIFRL